MFTKENKVLRQVAVLIPHCYKNDDILVYLQKRGPNMKKHPNQFGLFGGGIEQTESPEDALKREIKEELDFILVGFKYFNKYESSNSIKNVFTLEVSNDFENKITILEGEYGKWFTNKGILDNKEIIESDKMILLDFYKSFEKN